MKDLKASSNPLISKAITLFFEFLKQGMRNFELARSAKKIDKFRDQIATIENLVLKLENQIHDNRKKIEAVKTQLLWSLVMNGVSLVFIILLFAKGL